MLESYFLRLYCSVALFCLLPYYSSNVDYVQTLGLPGQIGSIPVNPLHV